MDAARRDVRPLSSPSRVRNGIRKDVAAWGAMAGCVIGAFAAGAVEETPRLATRLGQAAVVAHGRVSRVRPFDHDRVRVIHLSVDRTLKGGERLAEAAGVVEIVEMRDRPSAPALLEAGDTALVFLRRARRGSYLDATLGPGRRWEIAGGLQGRVRDRDPVVTSEAADLVERIVDRSRAPAETPEERAAERRAWVFDALAARHAMLVEDGAVGLEDVPALRATLSTPERAAIEGALRRSDLPPRVRAAVFRGVAGAGLRTMVTTLASVPARDAVVLEAAWAARTSLGAPPGEPEIALRLRDGDPEVRAVAVRFLARTLDPERLEPVAQFLASESDASVRVATLEALGPLPGGQATELLERAFVEDDALLVRQAAGRVLFERGGDAAAESFARLAYRGPAAGQRHAVALLLALGRPADDPMVERIRSDHPDPSVRELAEHGFRDAHH